MIGNVYITVFSQLFLALKAIWKHKAVFTSWLIYHGTSYASVWYFVKQFYTYCVAALACLRTFKAWKTNRTPRISICFFTAALKGFSSGEKFIYPRTFTSESKVAVKRRENAEMTKFDSCGTWTLPLRIAVSFPEAYGFNIIELPEYLRNRTPDLRFFEIARVLNLRSVASRKRHNISEIWLWHQIKQSVMV